MRRLFAVVTLLALAACGGDSSTGINGNIAGTYNLSTVNGSGLPFVLQAANPKVEILSDQLIVNGNGTFSENGSFRVTNGTQVTTQVIPDAGTYTINGTAVSFVFNSDGSTGTGTLSGNSLIIAQSGFSSVYTKQ
jgi:hypothetical protein